MSSHQFAYAQKRRSTRIDQAIPLLVQGVGAMREPYQEQVSTVSISCHGCTYQSKHEVIQGEIVYLDVKPARDGSVECSTKGRVKWAQKVSAKDRIFQIAVELELAGNIWGIPAPPADWFPARIPEAVEPTAPGRELRVVARKELPLAPPPVPAAVPDRATHSERSAIVAPQSTASAPAPPLAQLMVGLGQQIQTMASEAASSALVKERSRVLEEFRAQLREEAVKTIQSAIAASKDVIVRQATKELSDAQEDGARKNYALWMKKVQQDMESARQHVLVQGKEVSQRLDGMAAGTIERVQHNMEATRSEAVNRFVTRLRDQVAPMLAEAKVSLQKLEASKTAFKKESEGIYAGLENQLEFTANASLAKTQEELERNSAAIAGKTNDALLKLYHDFEKAAQSNVESLLASIGSQMTRILQEKAVEVSRQFTSGLEGYTRNYLESIGKSIAELPKNIPGRPRQ